MMSITPIQWNAVVRDARFVELHRRKSRFAWTLMAVSLAYYLTLLIAAAYFQNVFRLKVWGVLNVGLLFALSQFLMTWFITIYYVRTANSDFDKMALAIADDVRAGRIGAA